MKKTLLLTHEYYPFNGGIANYCYNFFKFLDNYLVVTDQLEIDNSLNNIISTPLLSKFWRPRWRLGIRKVRDIVKKQNTEIIFTPHIFPLGQIAYKIKQQLNIPYVISLHGLDINLAIKKNRRLAVNILDHASHVIVNSLQVKKIVESLNISSPVTVIAPAFDATLKKEDCGDLKKVYSQANIILTVGRLVERKGHTNILKALATIADDNFHYLIVGQGPNAELLQQLTTRLGLTAKVTFLPNVSPKELPKYYSLATMFVMPTRQLGADIEGYGIVYLEASEFALPIIAGQGTSAEEIITNDKNGLLVNSEDPEQIAEAIKKLISNKDLAKRLGQEAQRYVKALPSIESKVVTLKQILS